jgi:hypothetical protein
MGGLLVVGVLGWSRRYGSWRCSCDRDAANSITLGRLDDGVRTHRQVVVERRLRPGPALLVSQRHPLWDWV